MAVPSGDHVFNVPPTRDPFLSAEEAGEELASGPRSLREKLVKGA